MAKATGLVKQDTAPLAVVPDNLKGGLQIEGDDSGGPQIGRLKCYSATATEEKKYGDDTGFKRGDFIDPLERRNLGKSVKVAFVGGWKEWVYWPKDAQTPVYRHTSKSQVPPDDLKWDDSTNPHTPPRASEVTNAICVVEGEAWPYVFTFKGTSARTWEQVVKPFEGRRASRGQGPGLYELTTADDKNSKNQDYKRVIAKPAGEPSQELIDLAAECKASLVRVKASAAAKVEEDDRGDDENDIPL